MPGRSSWMPYAPQRVKGFDDDVDDDDDSEEHANHVCSAISPLLRYCAFREENLVRSSELKYWMNIIADSRSVTL